MAGGCARQERGQDARICVHARRDVGDGNAHTARRRLGSRNRDQSDLALHEQVVRLFPRERTRRAVTRDVADDQPGVAGAQIGRQSSEPRGRAGREILHEDIRALAQTRQHGVGVRTLQIERQRFLRSIQPDEITRQTADGGVIAAREVAAVRPLDLDHPRAEDPRAAASRTARPRPARSRRR